MKNLKFDETILSIHKEIQVKLKKTNIKIDNYIKSDIPVIPKLSKYFFNKRGKQLRPVLCLLSSKMINKEYSNLKSDISMAAALEFIHAATLLHDDVIDKGKTRRGQRSVNDIWNNKFSVLLGDFMFSKSFQLMTEAQSLKAMESLANVSAKISEGEFLQMSNENNTSLSISEYMQIISLKTAELFGAAMKIPAILTDKNNKIIEQLNFVGINFGMIFQIIDDHLDYFGTYKTGKSKGQDFFEGKITLPIIILLKKANLDEKKLLKKIFHNKKRTKKDFLKTLALLEKYNVESISLKYANNLKQKSKNILKRFKNRPSYLLGELLDTSINRKN
ncbi:MAG: polyprenyl synthetase family protein [alpha proteobacterium HIMB59]|nr:MAG: polyprenyl synthetase family protein [alpha proteobacterium HIMB59]